jgi:hypothetical protein
MLKDDIICGLKDKLDDGYTMYCSNCGSAYRGIPTSETALPIGLRGSFTQGCRMCGHEEFKSIEKAIEESEEKLILDTSGQYGQNMIEMPRMVFQHES